MSFVTCVLVATSLSLPVAATVMRLSLVAAVVAFAVVLVGSMGHAAARAELDRTLVSEAHHRIKNSLQAVADLLLLARPDGEERQAFDESAMRIRSIAAVHRLLSPSTTALPCWRSHCSNRSSAARLTTEKPSPLGGRTADRGTGRRARAGDRTRGAPALTRR